MKILKNCFLPKYCNCSPDVSVYGEVYAIDWDDEDLEELLKYCNCGPDVSVYALSDTAIVVGSVL